MNQPPRPIHSHTRPDEEGPRGGLSSADRRTGEAERADACWNRLTPAQRSAQTRGVWFKDLLADGRFSEEACERLIPDGIGFVSQFGSCTDLPPERLSGAVLELQRWLVRRVGVPAIVHEEAISGLAARGATTFPQQIGMSCAWDADLIEGNARAIADTFRAAGANQCLSPVLDVLDDARWGRAEEGFGESPYLAACLGLAFIRGVQSRGVGATAKHFLGYGSVRALRGPDFAAALFPHEVAVRQGDVASVMLGYHAVDGRPCTASTELVKELLRGRLGFSGTVLSDYFAIPQIATQYRAEPDVPAAARAALSAGVDADLPDGESFLTLGESPDVRALLDTAARRVLRCKARLGLLDAPPAGEFRSFNPPDHQDRSERSAVASLVLLRNDGVLPLAPNLRRVALVGPHADSVYALLGDYTYQMLGEYWWRRPVDAAEPRLWTLRAGLRARLPAEVELHCERGCDWTASASSTNDGGIGDPRQATATKAPLEPTTPTDPEAAVRRAAACDVIIAALGEHRYLGGEGCDRPDADLQEVQGHFLDRLLATGRPVVLVLFGGRPLALGNRAERCAAILQAWYPGQSGGLAVADLLLGHAEPRGRLTMTMPRVSAEVPTSHRRGYAARPLYAFGHGLTYTWFHFVGVPGEATVSTSAKEIVLQWSVANRGPRAGTEVAQAYLESGAGLELVGFARVVLEPGSARLVTLRVPRERWARRDEVGRAHVSPGPRRFRVGASSVDLRLGFEVLVEGPERTYEDAEATFSAVTLGPPRQDVP